MNPAQLADKITYGIRDLRNLTQGTPEYEFAYWDVVARAMRAAQFALRYSFIPSTDEMDENPGIGKFTMGTGDSGTIRFSATGLDNLDWFRALGAVKAEQPGLLIMYLTELPSTQLQVDVDSIILRSLDDGQQFAIVEFSNSSGAMPFEVGQDVSFTFFSTQGNATLGSTSFSSASPFSTVTYRESGTLSDIASGIFSDFTQLYNYVALARPHIERIIFDCDLTGALIISGGSYDFSNFIFEILSNSTITISTPVVLTGFPKEITGGGILQTDNSFDDLPIFTMADVFMLTLSGNAELTAFAGTISEHILLQDNAVFYIRDSALLGGAGFPLFRVPDNGTVDLYLFDAGDVEMDQFLGTNVTFNYFISGLAQHTDYTQALAITPTINVYQVLVGAIRRSITQTAHGLALNSLVYLADSGLYALAMADNELTSEIAGIVSAPITTDSFVLHEIGPVTGLTNVVIGRTYYLSDTVPGGYTSVAPSNPGTVNKPVFNTTSNSIGMFSKDYRGVLNVQTTNGNAILDFTDGETVKRFTITDANVLASSKIVGAIQRSNPTNLDSSDCLIYDATIVSVSVGSFDLLVSATDGVENVSLSPPNETVSFFYSVLSAKQVSLPFTNDDTIQRFTFSDPQIESVLKLIGGIARPNVLDSDDVGFFYNFNLIHVGVGSFMIVVFVSCPERSNAAKTPPSETPVFNYITNDVSTTDLDFTDGNTVKRFNVVDSKCTASSRIIGTIVRPTYTEDTDLGFLYSFSVQQVSAGSFDVLVSVSDGTDDVSNSPPSETIQFCYRIIN